jgi:splicing factor 3A subunit 3
MKCLKIPNTVHFKGVTGIEEALKLHQTLLSNKKREDFRPENEEEFEDEQGNVVTKRMYDDLVRQGIIHK